MKRALSRRALMTATVLSLLLLSCRDGVTAGDKPASADLGFRLKTVDGRTIGPRDFEGQVVVVDFWATWCVPCHLQARILEPIHRDYKGKGVQFLAANVGEDEPTVRSFLKRKPMPYPVLLDPEDTVSSKLGVVGLPTLLVIDRKGRVTFFHTGVADAATVRKVLQQAGV
ncbi:MAG: TlpA family protein disulfide reductase [Thermoanaerobaculia bacterium]